MTETGKGSGSARCERCGRDNPLNLRFCQDCGNRLAPASVSLPRPEVPPVTCARCGASNPQPGRFCVNCGAAFDGAPPASIPKGASPGHTPPPGTPPPLPAARELSSGARPADPPASAARPSPIVVPQARPLAPPPPGTASLERTEALSEATIPCSRCRGSNAPHMTFCQFCGARLNPDALPAPPPGSAAAVEGAFPHAPEPARLVVIAQDGTPGRQYPLAEQQIDIGREEGAILLPSDPYVSPRHARISRREGRIFVRDLSSVNGVYVRIRAAERLQHADLVLIGLEVLRFEVVSDAEKGLGPATERGTRVFGSPALPRYARLCQRTVEGATRDVFYLGREETVIGRESGDLVFTNDPFMSRRHATFTRDSATNQFTLQDLGSSNGTYLAIRGEHELHRGDHVRIGQHLFRLDVEAGRTRP